MLQFQKLFKKTESKTNLLEKQAGVEISEELLTKKCSDNNEITPESKELQEESTEVGNVDYSKIRYGEVYLCNYGNGKGKEQQGECLVIIVQNDQGNSSSPTTIVVACAEDNNKKLPVHYLFTFSSKIMVDYQEELFENKQYLIKAEQIRTIDKSRLCKYMGTLTPEFMQHVQKRLKISLNLKQTEKKERKRTDINTVQIQLLSLIDMNQLLKIANQKYCNEEEKIKQILQLFGFDLQKKGVNYLFKAILLSPVCEYFNLETLAGQVAKSEDADYEEVRRLIVARVKEKINFQKAPTIDFIRLINCVLNREEVEEATTDLTDSD